MFQVQQFDSNYRSSHDLDMRKNVLASIHRDRESKEFDYLSYVELLRIH